MKTLRGQSKLGSSDKAVLILCAALMCGLSCRASDPVLGKVCEVWDKAGYPVLIDGTVDTPYPQPKWAPGYSFPLCYARQQHIHLEPHFPVSPPDASGSIVLAAVGTTYFYIPPTTHHVTGGGPAVGFRLSASDVELPNEVDLLCEQVHWYYRLDQEGAPWQAVGTSDHQICVVLEELPPPWGLFHTVLKLACENPWATTTEEAFNNTWWWFNGRNVTTWDGQPLYYYQPGTTFDRNPPDVYGLLETRRGQCTAWTQLME